MERHRQKMVVYSQGEILEEILPSHPSERTSPANALTSDAQPPEPRDNEFLLFQPPSLWDFVTAALAH